MTAAPPAAVWTLVPARDEARSLSASLPSLLAQDYPDPLRFLLTDDGSTDGTGDVARQLARDAASPERLTFLPGAPRSPGWTGKLWALEQGLREAGRRGLADGDWLLLTDADIVHPPDGVRRLVARAERDDRDLVSLMVTLRCESPWERLLIPAFVFFFGLLYPFRWVNDDRWRGVAAAAGGCILVRAGALRRAGGLTTIRGELIDDCALARVVKASGGRLWLGHGTDTRSVRAYDTLGEIWRMVARTADTQLRHSLPLLAGTVSALGLFLVAPPALALGGALAGNGPLAALGASAWIAWAWAYGPTVRRYGRPRAWAFTLPLAGFLYGLMTLDSARRHRFGRGGAWKGRTYDRLRRDDE